VDPGDGLLWSGRALGDRYPNQPLIGMSRSYDGLAVWRRGLLVMALEQADPLGAGRGHPAERHLGDVRPQQHRADCRCTTARTGRVHGPQPGGVVR
jgi:hypothetical protein